MNFFEFFSRAANYRRTVLLLAAALLSAPLYGADQPALFTAQKAEALLKAHVLANSAWRATDVELRVVNFTPPALTAGRLSPRILKSTRGVTPGPSSFLVALDVAGKEQTRFWVKAEIRVFDTVVVSSAALAHHEIIRAKDLRLERRDISALNGRPYKRIEDVAGQQATRIIDVNEILTQKALARPVLMRRGVPVTLVYETASLRVESPGLTVEDGRIGDAIQVKNPSSGKVLRGVVVDARTVRVN